MAKAPIPQVTLLLSTILLSCNAQGTDPASTPTGQACRHAYTATVSNLSARWARRGRAAPSAWPSEAAYIEQCIDLEMTLDQLACLDPQHAAATPSACALELKPAKSQVDALSRWFNAELKKGHASSRSRFR